MTKAFSLRRQIKNVLFDMGIVVRRRSSMPIPLINFVKPTIVLDVGANIGQYALSLRKDGYSGKIVSFEPTSSAYLALKNSAVKDANWIVHDRLAIGKASGTAEIFISANSFSSSLLPILNSHIKAAPDSYYVEKELVKVATLDEVSNNYLHSLDKAYLKIDVQGSEIDVIMGAKKTLKHIHAIEIEVSFVPLYKFQPLYHEIFELLTGFGFDLWNLEPSFQDPVNGRLLQADAFFLRREGIPNPN